MRTLALASVALGIVMAGCQFDDSALTDLRPCTSQVDCTSPLSPFCAAGRCVPGEPTAEGEVSEEEGPIGTDDGDDHSEDQGGEGGEGEGEGPPPGDPPVAVGQAPANASLGDVVPLSGVQSVGRGLVFLWTVTSPDAAEVEVTQGEGSAASFIAAGRGTYRVSLRVADDVHRTDIGQEQEVEVAAFEALERALESLDIGAAPDGEAAWVSTADGASRARLLPAPEDDPDAARVWDWTEYDGSGQGTDRVTVGPRSAWLARTGSGALRVKRSHEPDDPRPATAQALPGVGRVRAMAVGPQRRIWFGGDDGMRRTLGNEGGSLGPPLDLPGERSVIALHAADSGLWVGRPTGACLAEWTDDPQLSCTREIAVLEDVDHFITAMAEDGAGDLWIATDGQGLYRVGTDDTVEAIAPGARGLPAGRLTDLAADPSGDVWGIGGDGLFRVYPARASSDAPTPDPDPDPDPDPPEAEAGVLRIQRFETASGLLVIGALRAITVASGEDADVWVAGERGIARLDR